MTSNTSSDTPKNMQIFGKIYNPEVDSTECWERCAHIIYPNSIILMKQFI